ncbi:MAG: thioredoxin-disulfide reductase [Candidatus Microgenomates bacterium]
MENVVIIGGGVAGLSTAVYLSRAGFSPLVFAGSPPGGQLTLTSEVENFPGHESILGAQLVDKIRQQAVKFGAKIIDQNIIKVDLSESPFKLYFPEISSMSKFFVSSGSSFSAEAGKTSQVTKNLTSSPILAKSLIIATGAKALWLNVPGEQKLRGKGVSACATCDGFFFKDKVVAVVGGGDTALEEALTLTKFAKKVYIIHRRDSFRASKIMQERVFNNAKIEIIWNAQVEEVLGENKVEGVKIAKLLNGQMVKEQILLDGVFVAIGHKPDTDIFKGQIELDEKGYVITSERAAIENIKYQISNIKYSNQISNIYKVEKYNFNYKTLTSVNGVFAAGDCVDYQYRQAATAAGYGVAAALEVERWLES